MIRNKDVPITPEYATLADLDLNLNDPTNPNIPSLKAIRTIGRGGVRCLNCGLMLVV